MKYKPYKNKFLGQNYFLLIMLLLTGLLHKLPFYEELNVVEISKAFQGYARSYKVEILDSKDLLVELKTSKSSIKDLFKDFLNELESFKYQITVAVLLSKHCFFKFCN